MAKHRDMDKWTEREEKRLERIAFREASRAKQEKNDQRRLKRSLRDRFLILGETLHNAFPPETPTKVILNAIQQAAWETTLLAPGKTSVKRDKPPSPSKTTSLNGTTPTVLMLDQVEA